MTADFQRVYSLRLADAVRDRDEDEILDLVIWLPRGSALHVAQEAKGDQTKAAQLYGWSQADELTLGLVNLVRHQTYVIAQSNSKKKIQAPKPMAGPRDSGEKPKNNDANSIAKALLAAQP